MRSGFYALMTLLLAGLLWHLLSRADAGSSGPRPVTVAAPQAEPPREPLASDVLTLTGGEAAVREAVERRTPDGPPAEPAAIFSPAALARVRVMVVDSGSGTPLAGVPVRIDPLDREAVEPRPAREIYGWMEAQGWGSREGAGSQLYLAWAAGMPRTDERGLCLLPWPIGVPFDLLAGDPELDVGWVRHAESALVLGEERELILEAPVGADYNFHGRVLSALEGTPIAGAEVYTLSDEWRAEPTLTLAPARERRNSEYLELVAHSDEDGRFALGGRSWKLRPMLEDERVLVLAEGFCPSIVGVTRANDRPERALTMRLAEAAEIQGFVIGSGGPGRVELRCAAGSFSSGNHLPTAEKAVWSAAWQEDGSFVLGDLPAEVSLDVWLRLESGEVQFPSKAITLRPGESRVVDWALSGTALVRGVVVDEHDEVVVGVPVGAFAIEGEPPESVGHGVIQMFGAPTDLAARDETDSQGRFELTGLGIGLWAVGVVIVDYPPDLDVSATGVLVEVPEGATEFEARVFVFRELSISGVALGPDGNALAEVYVDASSIVGEGFANLRVDAEGRFELGPLAPGAYRVGAWAPDRLIYFPSLEVEAGASEVVLQGRAAGGLRGRVFQADGSPPERVRVRLDIPGSLDSYALQTSEGSFVISPLPPGVYDLVLSSPGGDALALTAQVVVPGSETQLPDLYLEPAGRLFLKIGERSARIRATLRGGGAEYPVDFWPKQSVVLILPPGSYELELPAPAGEAPGPTVELVVRAGEERHVDLELEAEEARQDGGD